MTDNYLDPTDIDGIIEHLKAGGVEGANLFETIRLQADPVRWLCDAWCAIYAHNQELRRKLILVSQATNWMQDATLPTTEE